MRRFLACVGLSIAALIGARENHPQTRYPSPRELALSPDGSKLYVLCEGTDEILVIDAAAQKIIGRAPVGGTPRGLSLSPDGRRLLVANSWSDSLTEIDVSEMRVLRSLPTGFEPTSVVYDKAGKFAYAANRISNDVSVISLETGEETKRLTAGRGASYMAMSADGKRLFVSHVYPNVGDFRAQPQSEITEIETKGQTVENRHRLPNVAGVFHIALSSDGRLGIASALRPKNLIPLAHVAHGWAFGNSISLFGEDVDGVVQAPLDQLERYFSIPYGVVIAPDKKTAYVSASGSDEVAAIDIPALIRTARSPNKSLANDLSASARYVTAHIPVGANPKGMAMSADGSIVYVANRLDDTVSVIDARSNKVRATIALGGPTALTPERKGERLFNTSRFSFQGEFGCANCHIDATFDGLSWDLEPDGFGIEIVDNKPLEDVGPTAPFKWNGGNPDLETECGPRTEKFFFRSQSFSQTELADLVTYIKAIPLRPNRYRLANGELTPAQERGQMIFERTKKKNGQPIPEDNQCPVCHSGEYYTNRQLTNVGSFKPTDRSPMIDTPHLKNIALTAPYLHDGSAKTLEEIWTIFSPKDTHGVTNDLSKDELNDLIEYLKTL